MSTQFQPDDSRPIKPRSRWPRVAALGSAVAVGCCILYCCGTPFITGQSCIDFVSGHVPTRAEDIFFQRIFSATVNSDYDWLATIATKYALQDLKTVQPKVTAHYEITGGDDLGGTYERTIRFDNGTVMYLTYWSNWPTCPDLVVTEQEVFSNMQIMGIEVVEPRP